MSEQRGGAEREATAHCERVQFGKTSGIVTFAPPTQKIVAGGRIWHFEWHHYFGPAHLKKNGDPHKNQPDEKSPFWDATHYWHQQGCRIDASGFAQWDDPRAKKRARGSQRGDQT